VTVVVDGIARVAAPFRATLKQRELAKHWKDPDVKVELIGGAIRSGKTQAAARLIVETTIEQPAVYLVARSTYRELEDSTKKALLFGDGNMPPLIPPELIDAYRVSDNVIKLKTGAEILFRSLEESQVGKVMNLTLGGVFIDQIEELDGGEARHLARWSQRSPRTATADRGREPGRNDSLGASQTRRRPDARRKRPLRACDPSRQRPQPRGRLRP
jgi:hypothetical protein